MYWTHPDRSCSCVLPCFPLSWFVTHAAYWAFVYSFALLCSTVYESGWCLVNEARINQGVFMKNMRAFHNSNPSVLATWYIRSEKGISRGI